MPDRQRAELCRAALKTAVRDEEKKLALEVVKQHPSIDMLRVAVEAAKIRSLKTDAAGISLLIAQRIGGKSADVREDVGALEQVQVRVGGGGHRPAESLAERFCEGTVVRVHAEVLAVRI